MGKQPEWLVRKRMEGIRRSGYKHSEETRKKIGMANSISLKGNVPWNKGKKTGHAPWLGKKRPNVSGENNWMWKGGSATLQERRRISYLKKDKEKIRQIARVNSKRRRLIPRNRLNYNIASKISSILKGKKAGRSWESLVGYKIEDLISHLENRFDSKMNWENYGNYWHLDHIKPRSLFNFTTPEEHGFKDCWALENLQPLEKIQNIKKSNKYPFLQQTVDPITKIKEIL